MDKMITVMRKNYVYIRLSFSLMIFLSLLILFILDMRTYPNVKGGNSFLWWFSVWSLFFSVFSCFILCIHDVIYFKKKANKNIRIIYYFLLISAASYCTIVFLIYNGLEIFAPTVITDDPKTLQSIVEHRVTPLLFNLYFLMNIKKYKNEDIKIFDLFLKIILPSFLYPTIYIIYSLILYYDKGIKTYFIFDIHTIGFIKFFGYMTLSYFLIFVGLLVYSTELLIEIFKKEK